MPIRVAITDDHPLVINGLRNTLALYDHIEFCGGYTTGGALLEYLNGQQPDVLLLDVQLPDLSGNKLAAMISEQWPEMRILALSAMDSSFHVLDMLQSGCAGYLLKHTDEATLIAAIEQVHSGGQYIDPTLKDVLLESMIKTKRQTRKLPMLTQREKEILQLIAAGCTSATISEKLNIALRTVENHRFSIMQKLDVSNTVTLVRLALQMGLVK